MRLLSEAMVDKILPIDIAIDSAVDAFKALSDGTAKVPLRGEIYQTDPKGTVLVMPGMVGKDILGVKLVGSVVDQTMAGGKHTTCMMMIWDARNLRVRGLIAADRLNEHRTAAGFAAATRVLARETAAVHTVIGAGKLSYATVLHISQVRQISKVVLVSRTRQRVEALAARLRAALSLKDTEIVTDMMPDDAAEAADIITTVTTAEMPVFDGARVRPGTHINLGGAGRPHEREMDDAAASRASFWLDSGESCRRRTGDIVIPLESGAIRENQIIGEIGELMLGKVRGRVSAEEITVFKSLGVATQDLVLGARLFDLAEAQNLGTIFDEAAG